MNNDTRISSRADVVGERITEDDDRGGAGQQTRQCRPRVRQHPHSGCAGGVVEYRERDGRDQPHRHHRRPAALAQAGVQRLDPRMGHKAVEPPAGGADQQQCEPRALIVLATTAIPMPSHGPNRRPEASVNAVRGNGNTVTTMCAARKANGNHGPTEVAQSRSCMAPGRGTSNKIATRITIVAAMAANLAPGHLLRRPDHRGAQRCEGADDGLHVYQDYGPRGDNSLHAGRESAARRTLRR